MSYNQRILASALFLRCFAVSFGHFFGFSNNNYIYMYIVQWMWDVQSGHTWTTERMRYRLQRVCYELTVSKQKLLYHFLDLFHAICKFMQFPNCTAQIRNYEIANQFQSKNPIWKLRIAISKLHCAISKLRCAISKLRCTVLKFRYRQRRDHVQEPQGSII